MKTCVALSLRLSAPLAGKDHKGTLLVPFNVEQRKALVSAEGCDELQVKRKHGAVVRLDAWSPALTEAPRGWRDLCVGEQRVPLPFFLAALRQQIVLESPRLYQVFESAEAAAAAALLGAAHNGSAQVVGQCILVSPGVQGWDRELLQVAEQLQQDAVHAEAAAGVEAPSGSQGGTADAAAAGAAAAGTPAQDGGAPAGAPKAAGQVPAQGVKRGRQALQGDEEEGGTGEGPTAKEPRFDQQGLAETAPQEVLGSMAAGGRLHSVSPSPRHLQPDHFMPQQPCSSPSYSSSVSAQQPEKDAEAFEVASATCTAEAAERDTQQQAVAGGGSGRRLADEQRQVEQQLAGPRELPDGAQGEQQAAVTVGGIAEAASAPADAAQQLDLAAAAVLADFAHSGASPAARHRAAGGQHPGGAPWGEAAADQQHNQHRHAPAELLGKQHGTAWRRPGEEQGPQGDVLGQAKREMAAAMQMRAAAEEVKQQAMVALHLQEQVVRALWDQLQAVQQRCQVQIDETWQAAASFCTAMQAAYEVCGVQGQAQRQAQQQQQQQPQQHQPQLPQQHQQHQHQHQHQHQQQHHRQTQQAQQQHHEHQHHQQHQHHHQAQQQPQQQQHTEQQRQWPEQPLVHFWQAPTQAQQPQQLLPLQPQQAQQLQLSPPSFRQQLPQTQQAQQPQLPPPCEGSLVQTPVPAEEPSIPAEQLLQLLRRHHHDRQQQLRPLPAPAERRQASVEQQQVAVQQQLLLMLQRQQAGQHTMPVGQHSHVPAHIKQQQQQQGEAPHAAYEAHQPSAPRLENPSTTLGAQQAQQGQAVGQQAQQEPPGAQGGSLRAVLEFMQAASNRM